MLDARYKIQDRKLYALCSRLIGYQVIGEARYRLQNIREARSQGRLLFVYFTHNIAAGAHDMALY
jgi:hypothetical protein